MAETLFDLDTKIRCHKNDPDTSRQAAQKINKKLNRAQKMVMAWIREYCRDHSDFTPKEVAGGVNKIYYDIQRRKNELANKLYIVKTGEERRGCEVWRLI